MRDLAKLPDELRRRAASGSSMVDLVHLVHEAEGVRPYNRGIVMHWFHKAFGLSPLDFTEIVFACELFGDGATLAVAEANHRFRLRLVELDVTRRHFG